MQDPNNRQASLPCDDPQLIRDWEEDQKSLLEMVNQFIGTWGEYDIAHEVLRVIYPEGLTMSRLYATANVRDWWHYTQLRQGNGTQPEHAELAGMIADAIEAQIPETWAALEASV